MPQPEPELQPEILILRDPRESAKKCSLTPLRGMPGIEFVPFGGGARVDADGRVLLTPDADVEISGDDAGRGLFVIDSSWRRVPKLLAVVDGELIRRKLPPLVTAYPRKSRVFADPDEGLASVEALYAALVLVGQRRPELLEGYRWGAEFLAANPRLMR